MNATKSKATKLASQWLVFNTRGEIVGTSPLRDSDAWFQAEDQTGLTREQARRLGYLCVKCDIIKAREE